MTRAAKPVGLVSAAIARATGFLAFWLMLAGVNPADLPAAVIAVVAATWTSLHLLPPGTWRLSPIGVAKLALRFPVQSVIAGVDVAWRALDPKLPLRPGFVTFRSQISPGTGRDAFCTLASLMPGTLPVGSDEQGTLLVHCLDVGRPVVAQLAGEEARCVEAVGGRHADG